ncbi:1-deoxy-D-xylulose-5-phosphate synthase [Streptomyces hygroscopicus]|uniref:1-deoxy-D-xylulose-5-phosphate synthase n=1 Tax=Streptomyces hygroscopicus TaxID=1912 RepID=UPI00223F696E|nr:1-deoxy-D-xylulose-5-phosphate synthase [Streptomyces hygroscopicus]MCW7944333.1 1-deoxy-D-xylulose-5-phosphate synthase [Streptomyces hygroscopicus]
MTSLADKSVQLDGLQPRILRRMDRGELVRLAHEIRSFLVTQVAASGGHLGSNLGAVELAIALHRVFDSPRDALLFDTGHQSYVHKILTGRAGRFSTLRQADGLSGYPSRAESPHDWIENSHASTVLSYADGLAKARALQGHQGRVVALIGDGALTGGMAWEALNNLGAAPERPVIVVLNDNGRAYAPTAGRIGMLLADMSTGQRGVPPQHERVPGAVQDNLFTTLGFAYVGPVDGHDEQALERALRRARDLGGPVVVHAVTAKGRGYAPAENDSAERMHAIGLIDPATGAAAKPVKSTWTDAFAEELCRLAEQHPHLVAITAAMPGPTGLAAFAARYPKRFFDVGIAEQHAVTSAAGLAMGGAHPVVAIYSTFLNRAFDQVLMDVALHRLGVTFVLDRAGITGPDGASHHGMWDVNLLAMVPGLRLAAPRDPHTLRLALAEAVAHANGPTVVRYPKASAGADLPAVQRYGDVDLLTPTHKGNDVLLVAHGPLAEPALQAATWLEACDINVTVAAPVWELPVSGALMELAAQHERVVTVEDGLADGGAGSRLAHACRQAGVKTPVDNLGLPTAFTPVGDRTDLLDQAGLSASRLADHILTACGDTSGFITTRRPA